MLSATSAPTFGAPAAVPAHPREDGQPLGRKGEAEKGARVVEVPVDRLGRRAAIPPAPAADLTSGRRTSRALRAFLPRKDVPARSRHW